MFITGVCLIFLLKLKWPKNKSFYDLVGSLMALTHSNLINLFIKLELNNFTPTSPAKYCFCPRVFSRLQEGFAGRVERPG